MENNKDEQKMIIERVKNNNKDKWKMMIGMDNEEWMKDNSKVKNEWKKMKKWMKKDN